MPRNKEIAPRVEVKELFSKSSFGKAKTYPKPDRSKITPNLHGTSEKEVVDIGYYEGILSDGRPYRVEGWRTNGQIKYTYFMSSQGLELEELADGELEKDAKKIYNIYFIEFLHKEHLVRFKETIDDNYPLEATREKDHSLNPIWAINILMSDEKTIYVKDRIGLKAYL